jgi:hypothetical protein
MNTGDLFAENRTLGSGRKNKKEMINGFSHTGVSKFFVLKKQAQ